MPPSYASATDAYRPGTKAMIAGAFADAVPALEYAAEHGVLGAQLKLARIYANGRGVPSDNGKAFYIYRQIANQHAEISPISPVAKYIAEAFVAIGKYHVQRHSRLGLPEDPRARPIFSVTPRAISAMPTPNMSSRGSISTGRCAEECRARHELACHRRAQEPCAVASDARRAFVARQQHVRSGAPAALP